MAAENMRALLDEINTNTYAAMGEVTDLAGIKELMKNDHLFDGYKIMVEEDKIYNQHERELEIAEINKEIKEQELEVKRLEIEQRREQFILENEYKKDELELRKTIHLDEILKAQQEHARELDMIEIRKEENRLKQEELNQNRKQELRKDGIKIGFGIGGGILTWIIACIGNEGILNDTAKKLSQMFISNWPGKA